RPSWRRESSPSSHSTKRASQGRSAVRNPSPLEGEGGTQPDRAGRVRGYSRRTVKRAKSLRKEPTEAEKKLWRLLRSRQLNGAKFKRQQPIGPFIADFVCHERRLIIEADGGQHA